MRKIGGGLATLESEGCLSVVGFCIKHEVAPRKLERVVERVGALYNDLLIVSVFY